MGLCGATLREEDYKPEWVNYEGSKNQCSPSSMMVQPTYLMTRTSSRARVLDQRESSATAKRDFEDDLQRRISRLPTPARNQMISNIHEQASSCSCDEDSLEERLESLGMCMAFMEADGNCQFRALAFNLFGSQEHHAVARAAVTAHMRKHANFFCDFFDGMAEFSEYLDEMTRSCTWGDELTLRAAVEAYGCIAHVITSEAANWHLVYQPEHQEPPDPKIAICPRDVPRPKQHERIFLSYDSPIHYNAIVAKAPMIRQNGRASVSERRNQRQWPPSKAGVQQVASGSAQQHEHLSQRFRLWGTHGGAEN